MATILKVLGFAWMGWGIYGLLRIAYFALRAGSMVVAAGIGENMVALAGAMVVVFVLPGLLVAKIGYTLEERRKRTAIPLLSSSGQNREGPNRQTSQSP